MIISDLVQLQARKNPDKIAFIFQDKKIAYQELEEKALQCARGLKQKGVKKGITFGLVLRNSPEFVILSLALSKLGAVSVPINFLEKADRIALILKDAKAVGVLTSKEFYRAVLKASGSVPSIKKIYLRDGAYKEAVGFDTLLLKDNTPLKEESDENSLALLLYTSGTTGQPKGVMLTHKNILANTTQCLSAIKMKPTDKVLVLLPMFHSFAWTTCVMVPLKVGAVFVINESLLPFDPVIKTIWKHKIRIFVAVPQIYSALTSKVKGAKALVLRFLNPIRLCVSGAAPLPDAIYSAFQDTFKIPILQGYGLTETSPVVSINPEKDPRLGSVGKPLPGVAVKLCDDDGKEVKDGEVGEIWIKGDNVMQGYYHKPKETSLVLTKEGWLKSGDMGKMDSDGFLTIVDRKKDLIIVKGLNVYPQEVEAALAEHPSIQEIAVVGKMDPDTGEERIRAFVTLKDGTTLEKADLFDLSRKKLAPYKRPKDIVILSEMPKNALQKILKKDLRAR